MGTHHNNGVKAPSASAPAESDNARWQPGASVGLSSTDVDRLDSASASTRGAMWTEGEAYAEAYLERLHAEVAQPGELAVILAFLCGEMLHGACRVIERALGVHHA